MSDSAVVPVADKRTFLSYDSAKEMVSQNNVSHQPDELILAVMYKESSFNTSVRTSRTGAVGLMQVSAIAAQDVLRNYQAPGLPLAGEKFDLHDPATNVMFGSAYLDILVTRNHGSVWQALDSYSGHQPGYADQVLAAEQALKQNPADPIKALDHLTHGMSL